MYLIFTVFGPLSFSFPSHLISIHLNPSLEELLLVGYSVIFHLESYIIITVPAVNHHVKMLPLCVFPHLSLEHITVTNPLPWRKTLWPFTGRDGIR